MQLRKAPRSFPQDGNLHGALGLAQMRLGQREAAEQSFQQALRLDKDSRHIDKWRDLQAANRYWLSLQQGEAALAYLAGVLDAESPPLVAAPLQVLDVQGLRMMPQP